MADGEIRIDTTLTIDEAKKNLKKFESEVKSLAARLRTATVNFEALEETQRRMTAEGGKSTAEMSRMAENVAKAKDRVVVLERALADARESASTMSLAVKDMQFAQNERAAQALAEAAERQKKSIEEVVEREMERQRAMSATSSGVKSTTQSIDEQAQAAERVNTAFVTMRQSQTELNAELERATMKPLLDEFEVVKQRAVEISDKLHEMAMSGEAPRGIVGWQKAIATAQAELGKMENTISSVQMSVQAGIGLHNIVPDYAVTAIASARTELERISGSIDSVASKAIQMDALPSAIEKTIPPTKAQTSILRELASVAASVGTGIRKAFSGAMSIIGKFGTKLLGIGGIFKGIHRNTRTATNGFERMGKRLFGLAVTALVFNQIRRELRRLIAYYGDALKGNEQLYASFALLKGSALTAFQPLYEAAIPIIEQFVSWLTTAIQHLATFTSMLFGVDPKQMQANAKATWDNVKGLKAGAKAAEKFKAPFDELITLTDTTGADISEVVPDFAFEPPPTAPWMEKLKNIFKEVDFAYWFDSGATAAKRFTDVLNSIPWDGIREGAKTLGTNLAGLLGGFLSDEDMWIALGNTFVQGVATALDFLYNFIVNFPWAETGRSFALGLNTALTNQELWIQLGSTFAAGVNAAIDFLLNAVRTFDWLGFGLAAAAGLNTAIKDIKWAELGQLFSDSIEGILTSLNTFIQETDWYEFGKSILTAIENVDWSGIITLLFEGIGSVLGGLAAFIWGMIEEAWNAVVGWWQDVAFEDGKFTIQGLLDGIWEALKNIGTWIKENIFTPFISGFKKAFGIASPSTVMAEMGGFIIQGLINGISDLIGKVTEKASEIASGITDAVSGAVSKAKEVGGNIANAIGTGMSNAKDAVVGTAQKFGNAITNGVKDVFNIQSPSRVFRDEIGAMLGKGVAVGFENTAGLIKSAFTDTIGDAGDDVDGMENQGFSIGMSLLRGLELAYTPIVDFFRNLMSDIQSVISASLPTIPQITIPQLPRAGFLDSSTISAIAARGGQQSVAQINNGGGLSRQDVYAVVHDAFLDALEQSSTIADVLAAIRDGKVIAIDGQPIARISQTINNGRSAMLGGAV